MSLDVYLINPLEEPRVEHCSQDKTVTEEGVFDYNITHNLGGMAKAAGIYQHLWRPEELGIKNAEELVGPLTQGLEKLKAEPERFKTFNPSNGWGKYESLVSFVERYLSACQEYPNARVYVSR